jgi:hypothetical protein
MLPLPSEGFACAVDPATNTLAVTVYGSPAGVVVFKNESGTGTLYSTGIDSLYCGYDDASNLFIDGDTAGAAFRLVELPNGSASTVDISTSPAINQIPGQVEWDGSYLTVEAGILSNREKPSIYRLSLFGVDRDR